MTQSSLFTFYRQILAGGWSWWTHGFGARLTGWEASFGHLINLHLSSHPNITTCWSFLWGDSVSPERDLPDSSGEGGCRCLAEGCLRTRPKKAARRFVVLKVGCNCILQCSALPLPSSWTCYLRPDLLWLSLPRGWASRLLLVVEEGLGRRRAVGDFHHAPPAPLPFIPTARNWTVAPQWCWPVRRCGAPGVSLHTFRSASSTQRSFTFHTSLEPWLTSPVHTFLLSCLIPLLSCEGLGVSINTFKATTFN